VAAGDRALFDPGRLRADTSTSVVGFTSTTGMAVAVLQSVAIAPLMGLMVYLGTPAEPVNRNLLRTRLGRHAAARHSVSMIYPASTRQSSGLAGIRHVMALLLAAASVCSVS